MCRFLHLLSHLLFLVTVYISHPSPTFYFVPLFECLLITIFVVYFALFWLQINLLKLTKNLHYLQRLISHLTENTLFSRWNEKSVFVLQAKSHCLLLAKHEVNKFNVQIFCVYVNVYCISTVNTQHMQRPDVLVQLGFIWRHVSTVNRPS